jgi:hypothetical protein
MSKSNRNAAISNLEVKTGRRVDPSFEARDKTLCFILSESEKDSVDRLAFCMNITRSGLLAKIVTSFVEAAEIQSTQKTMDEKIMSYLAECRAAIKKRNVIATDLIKQKRNQSHE